MAEGGKLAEVRHEQTPGSRYGEWVLYVAGIRLLSAVFKWHVDEIRATADRINAAVEAEVERRLDEITKGAH